jgi:hypothetical protein
MAPWGAIIQAIDHAAGRITGGAGSGIEVAKSQNGGAANNSGSGTTDTTLFGKAIQTATNNIKDKVTTLNNNPVVEEEEENGTEETEGTI